ncbi:ATP-binding cassette domain-containing protein [Aidingimonas halophila]|uniref:Amino acid ABC transporter ATP-binding protein, PAAT family n=1 Tax=Aidingimonas halophila TaxID=574349 RepID=A0A1H3A678_9GAMM|nr:ATP-binding cassette domain-containing protein [Aidingimonas halophila]GHC21601.1 ABC transporter ATP-binding protein [Aidingimonas halophila]SDX24818.1 amino acid ABC transporter ATP-binding protein, PAAT family [Aidingimonas halophila]
MNDMHAASTSAPLLTLDKVTFRHRGQTLLQNISLTLSSQGSTIVMGPNGAGKSLLMRICHGLLTPTSGRLHWHDTGGRPPRQAMVFQRPVMLRRSAIANVTYALAVQGTCWRDRKPLAREALERFGLTDVAHRPARVLSGGEQQRLALARAWALRPAVLFLDEPTSALDPAAIKAVEDAVTDFGRVGTRIIMNTHDISQAKRLGDDVLFLCQGRVVEHNNAESFFLAPRTRDASAFVRGELVW